MESKHRVMASINPFGDGFTVIFRGIPQTCNANTGGPKKTSSSIGQSKVNEQQLVAPLLQGCIVSSMDATRHEAVGGMIPMRNPQSTSASHSVSMLAAERESTLQVSVSRAFHLSYSEQ
jgi:hypothetical protein